MKITNVFKRYPFTTLVSVFFILMIAGQWVQCFNSQYCFMWDYDEFIPAMFYTFIMISAELYHNKGKYKDDTRSDA